MLHIFAADPYNKIIRKLGSKPNHSVGSLSDEGDKLTLDPISPVTSIKKERKRLITVEPEKVSII